MEHIYVLKSVILEKSPEIQVSVILVSFKGLRDMQHGSWSAGSEVCTYITATNITGASG